MVYEVYRKQQEITVDTKRMYKGCSDGVQEMHRGKTGNLQESTEDEQWIYRRYSRINRKLINQEIFRNAHGRIDEV